MTYWKRICLWLLILSFLMIPVSGAEKEDLYDRYGYSQLENDAQRYAYEKIAEGIRCFGEKISLAESQNLSEQDITLVRDMIYSDYPEYFWFQGSFDYSHTETGKVVSFSPHYGVEIDGETVSQPNEKMRQGAYRVETMTQSIVRTLEGKSDYEKAELLYRYVAALVDYESTANDQNLYGALIEGKSVCSGYARMYQHLLLQAGIPAWWVSGTATDREGETENHAWTVLWLDGKCYYGDITWDDGEEVLFHAYFLRAGEYFAESHFPDAVYADRLPESCDHTDLQCQHGIDSEDIQSVADLANSFRLLELREEEAVYYSSIYYHGEDFSAWFENYFQQEILSLLGLKRAGAEWRHLGDEYQVTISGTPNEIAKVPTSELMPVSASVNLGYVGQKLPILVGVLPVTATNAQPTYESDNTQVVRIDSATGMLTAIGQGSANITVKIPEYQLSVICQVTVAAEPDTYPEFPAYTDPELGTTSDSQSSSSTSPIPDWMMPGVVALVSFVLLNSLFRKRR